MRASELRDLLQHLIELHGDHDVLVDTGCGASGLAGIDECDLDVDDNGFVIWIEGDGDGESDTGAVY